MPKPVKDNVSDWYFCSGLKRQLGWRVFQSARSYASSAEAVMDSRPSQMAKTFKQVDLGILFNGWVNLSRSSKINRSFFLVPE